ncbi:MAG TPA: malto-oligosyltrehalose trehalohydrolase [Pirellulales bacterium]|nr:malto-oligosyltrehalose trehalohydrolase [Pirellulales bacterium]
MFRVWIPAAQSVEIVVGQSRHTMERCRDGWWKLDLSNVEPGTDYGFSVDGGPTRPDPRSPWQPHGVHGPSRTVDHQAFFWTDKHWQAPPLAAAIIYELHIGTFSPAGTFDGAIGYLDHLVSLGVTHVEIMPVAEFHGSRGWGYDGVDLFAPQHSYGGPEGLKRLVDACHAKGLGVILDVVYNHLGPSGNYLREFGPYFTTLHRTPWGDAINFDGPHSDEVRRFFCDNALMWLRDYHFDGLRLDAVHAIVDTSAIPILEQLATEVDELKAHLGRHLVLIAESDLNDPRVVRPWEIGGFGIDAQWTDDVHHALHAVLTGERGGYYADFGTLADLATAMMQPYVYANRHSSFRQRRHGRPPLGLSGNKFVVFVQNHDQCGNRARGERMSQLVSHDRAKIGAALMLLSPFVPMLFQGQEWASSSPFQYFVDYQDEPELAQAVAHGRRYEFAAFGWRPEDVPDPRAEATFLRSRLNWEEVARDPHKSMLSWYKQLIRLRRTTSALTDGRMDLVDTEFDEEAGWLRVERGPMMILSNFADAARTIPLGRSRPTHLLLTSKAVVIQESRISLPAESVAILGPR